MGDGGGIIPLRVGRGEIRRRSRRRRAMFLDEWLERIARDRGSSLNVGATGTSRIFNTLRIYG